MHRYQQILHRNLVYLASIADAVPGVLPPPPGQPHMSHGPPNPQMPNPEPPFQGHQNQPSGGNMNQNQSMPTGQGVGGNQPHGPVSGGMQNFGSGPQPPVGQQHQQMPSGGPTPGGNQPHGPPSTVPSNFNPSQTQGGPPSRELHLHLFFRKIQIGLL
ncbi:UNVERIFIED_CONTAM: hypothetical protein NCL1_02104 [Trichonephila clavipes]